MSNKNTTTAELQRPAQLPPVTGSPSRRRRKHGPAERALKKFLPLLMMALAVHTNRIWLGLMFVGMAYAYLLMIEDDAEVKENDELRQPKAKP